ncbi:ral guanine nucleotide dissociation stimulator-like 3 isoform X1 [Pogona vitticeps]
MGKTELAMTPLQQWGEEVEDGAIYSIILERVKAEAVANRPCHLQEDSSLPDCPFVQYRTCKRRVLRAATLPRLVKWLVAAKAEGDLDYVPSFLATYQAFATSAQVLELLLPLGPNNCRAVLQVLELWLQHHPEDFWEPPEHHNLQKVLHFLHQSAPDSPACALAGRLLQGDKQKEEEEEEEEEERRKASSAAANAGGESPGMDMAQASREVAEAGESKEMPVLLSFPLDEVAEQLTLMDADLFRAVRPFHCTGCVWSHRDKKENQHMAPTVRATVAQFNAVTSCVITSVLGDLTLRTPQRAHLLEKWISVAQHCRALRNFSSLHAILSALQSNSIYRLKRTWAAVNRESRSTFRKLSQIFSEDNNYLNCREILMQEGGTESSCDGQSSPQMPAGSSLLLRPQSRPVAPTIPYLGTFLTDLIMLDTALPDFLEGNLINFEKRRKEAAILSCIHHLQESCQGYNLSLNPSFRDAFHQHQQLSEEQSYRISRVIEPTADSCPNSPKLHRSLTKRFSSLLLGSDSSGAPSGPDRSGISPLGSCNSLNSEDGSNAPCSPTWGSPTVKNFPVSQPRTSSPLELPPASPISKQRGTESRIVRVSMDNEHDNGNLYRSIVITSQDKTTAVVQRALQKHNLEGDSPCNYRLLQVLGDGQELLIPEGANAFYAMNPAGPHDFLLSLKEEATVPRSLGTTQLGGKTAPHSPLTFKDFGTRTPAATLHPTLSGHSPHSAPPSPVHLGPPSPAVPPQLRPYLLTPPPSPASSPWFPGIQPPRCLPESPPFSLSLPLPQHSLTLGPFRPGPPETVLPSPLQSPQTSSSVSRANPGYSLGASPNPCAAHPFSAP